MTAEIESRRRSASVLTVAPWMNVLYVQVWAQLLQINSPQADSCKTGLSTVQPDEARPLYNTETTRVHGRKIPYPDPRLLSTARLHSDPL